jgi:preprotein translocase subunit SecA
VKDVHLLFDAKFDGVEDERKLDIARRVYLHILDKTWQTHIDEMQYLREKVGLYGYAQLDPLVIYKKEAYDKFQRLLSNLKIETLANVFRVDLETFGMQQVKQTAPKKIDMMDILKAVTQGLSANKNKQSAKIIKEAQKHIKTLEDGEKVEVLEENDEFEILELSDEPEVSTTTADVS